MQTEATYPDTQSHAWGITFLFFVALTTSKSLASVPWIGTIALTVVSVAQLYIPISRCDRHGYSLAILGLHFKTWREDLRVLLGLGLLTLPLYGLILHVLVTRGHAWLIDHGYFALAHYVPQWSFRGITWHSASLLGVCEHILNQCLGVALPEEIFYRGYLQHAIDRDRRWTIAGAHMGSGALWVCAAFALGHFLGEWNPLRLLPFFPGLLFAWAWAKTGSMVAPVGYHALCNLFSAWMMSWYIY